MPLLLLVALLLLGENDTETRDYAVGVLQEAGYAVVLAAADAATATRTLDGGGVEALLIVAPAEGAQSDALAREAKARHRGLKVAVAPWLKEAAAQTVAPATVVGRLLRDLHASTAAPPTDATAQSMKAS